MVHGMTTRRSNPALTATRRWTAGVLLATTLAAGGLGVHLADAYANQSSTVAVSTTSGSGTTSSSSSNSSSFGTTGSVSASSNSASTTTKGS